MVIAFPKVLIAQDYKFYKLGYNYFEYPGYHIPYLAFGKIKGSNAYSGGLMYTLPGPMLKPNFMGKVGMTFNYSYQNNSLHKGFQPSVKLQFDISYYHTASPQIFWSSTEIKRYFFSRLHAHPMIGMAVRKQIYHNYFLEGSAYTGALLDYKWFFNTSYLRGPVRSTKVYLFKIDLIYVVDFVPRKKLIKF